MKTIDTLFRLIKWLWRAWPVLVYVVLLCGHLFALHLFPHSTISINKTVSLLAQLVGGLLILYSINSNIGIIKKKSLFALLTTYFMEFPLIKRSVRVSGQASSSSILSGKCKVIVSRKPKSIEEKIEYLQDQINEIKCELENETMNLNRKIDSQAEKMVAETNKINATLQNLESKIGEVSTGGIKEQLFGVLLIVHGAIAGYFI